MYKKRSTYAMKERTYYTTHLLYDSVQLTTSEDSLRRMQFSHFIDSMPFSRFDVRKNKNGRVTRVKVAKNDINREAYKRRKDLISEYDYLPGFNKASWYRKNYDQRLIKQENQFIAPEDTTEVVDEGFFVAEDFVGNDSLGVSVSANVSAPDSLGTDSLTAAQPVAQVVEEPQVTERYRFGYEFENNKFNEDQDYYNKEFGHLLVLKVKPPPPVEEVEEPEVESDTTAVKKKGFMSKFKRKKNKNKEEETVEEGTEPKEEGNN